MIQFLPALSSFFGSRLGIGVIGLVTTALTVVYFNFKIHNLEVRITDLEHEVNVERSAKLEIQRNRDELLAVIDRQNNLVTNLQLELQNANSAAEIAVKRRLLKLEAERQEILRSQESGHEEMNKWLRSQF